jgi:alkanesulfonate monooxygenase SsuD/methylene tetrahydromethanopterin reductase-like flavin-dependent oxidoreductase (luciferase family)
VGRVGDGWLVSAATPQEISDGRDIIFETAEQFDREIEEDHVGVMLGYYITPDVEEATTKAHDFITRHRPDVHFTEYTALGPAEKIAEIINAYAKAGASKFVVRPMCPAEETMEQLEIMGRDVLPMFHK